MEIPILTMEQVAEWIENYCVYIKAWNFSELSM